MHRFLFTCILRVLYVTGETNESLHISKKVVSAVTASRAPSVKKQAFSLKGATRRKLKAAGWEAEVGKGGTIWRNPNDVHWYDELRAVAILAGGLDPGGPS
jgi:hypothetical protein